jgi:hypothetical protein
MDQDKLLEIAERYDRSAEAFSNPAIDAPLEAMEKAARIAERAASGSWWGYQANVYYEDLNPPPPGAHFSPEYGFQQFLTIEATTGEWEECDAEHIKEAGRRLSF